MSYIKRFWIAFLLLVIGVVIGETAAFAKNTDNDVVLHQQDYTEYFKNEGHTKNYLYTKTEVPAPKPGKCIVITGASERTLSVFCNTNPS